MKLEVEVTTLGQLLKVLQAMNGLTQGDLSRELGVHTSQISGMCVGKNNLTLRSLAKLCQRFDLKYEDVVGLVVPDEEDLEDL